jgi:DNA-binding HxlR family transcriptional regulator
MIYNADLDEEILSKLKNENIGFNELSRKFPNLPKATLSKHLSKMEKQKIIERDTPEIGKHRIIRLTELAKKQIKYDLFQGVKTKRNKKISFKQLNEKEKKMTAIRLVIFRILRGSLRLNENPKNVFSAELLNGFVIDDLFESKHLGFGVHGSLLQSMKRSDVNECIRILKDEGIIKEREFYQNKGLYRISNELHNFLIDCLIVFQELVRLIESSWNSGKYSKEEVSWYGEFFGKDKALEMVDHGINDQTLNFENRLKKFYDYDEKAIQETKRNEIQRSRKLLKIYTKQLDQYKNTEFKYPLIWDIVMKVVEPHFLTQ